MPIIAMASKANNDKGITPSSADQQPTKSTIPALSGRWALLNSQASFVAEADWGENSAGLRPVGAVALQSNEPSAAGFPARGPRWVNSNWVLSSLPGTKAAIGLHHARLGCGPNA